MELLIVEYICNCDKNKRPVGHALPTLSQYYNLLKNDFTIAICSPQPYRPFFTVKYQLPFNTGLPQKRGFGSLIDTIKKIMNLLVLTLFIKKQPVLFVNADINVFMYLLFLRKIKKLHCGVILYEDFQNEKRGVVGRIKKYLYVNGRKNFSFILSSNKQLLKSDTFGITTYVPDFFYDDLKYSKYFFEEKKCTECLVVGTINKDKDIKGLIKVFRETKIDLVVAGVFLGTSEEKKELEQLSKNTHIKLEFGVLDEEAYYKKIYNAKFVILPYKQQSYFNRTSGVMLEALFLETPLIVSSFGEFNFISKNGLGFNYKTLPEIIGFIQNIDLEEYKKMINNIRSYKKEYDLINYKKIIIDKIGNSIDV